MEVEETLRCVSVVLKTPVTRVRTFIFRFGMDQMGLRTMS